MGLSRSAISLVVPGIAALALLACTPRPVHPVRTLSYPFGTETETLFVFLPGRSDRDWSFQKHGLIEAARTAGLRADLLAADLHFGYYRAADAARTLHEDVILPAAKKGYRRIWLVGVSAGGLAAILHEQRTPGFVSGIILLAPYLGDPEDLAALAAAGGLAAYSPGTLGEPEFISRAWLWLQRDARLPVFAGFGTNDPYAPPREMLEDAFGPERVVYLKGRHDWPTFRELFHELLGRVLAGALAETVGESPPAR